jgi:hypothetical protein
MKKLLLLLLLLPYFAIAQTSNGREFEVEAIKTTGSQTITTPVYLVTEGVDGTYGKTTATGFEKTANKQNNLTFDGSGVKYPTVDAVNTALNLKANLASPALTGTPTAPTPTTTTGIANKFYVDGLDVNNVKLTGSQTIAGNKTFSGDVLPSRIIQTNSSSGTAFTAYSNSMIVSGTGGSGLYTQVLSGGMGQLAAVTNGVGYNVEVLGNSGVGIKLISNSSTGDLLQFPSGKIDYLGKIISTAHVTQGGTTAQFVDGTGALQNKSIFQNTITGLTANYLPKWNGSGFGNSKIFDSGAGISFGGGTVFGGYEFLIPALGNNTIYLGVSDGVKNPRAFISHQTTASVQNVVFGSAFSSSSTTANWIFESGKVIIGTTDNGVDQVQVNGSVLSTQYKISALNTAPASATATGILGEIRVTATHIYVCTATNTWVRTALATW